MTFENRPWLSSYSPNVPADIDIPDITVDALLRNAAQQWPDRIAIDFFGATTTFAQLASDVSKAASILLELGVKPGDRVSLMLPNCRSHVVAFHAIHACGGVVVEHNPTYTAEELHDQFKIVNPTIALVWRNRVADAQTAAEGTTVNQVISIDVAADLPRVMRMALHLPLRALREKRNALTGADEHGAMRWNTVVPKAERLDRPVMRKPSDTALILFTGGTTGVPKGAEITHRNLVANAHQGQAWAQFTLGNEVVYGMLPFFHAFGMMFCLILPSVIGATLVAFPNFDPATVVSAQRRRPATFMPGVAPMFGRILDAAAAAKKPADFHSVALAFSGAMPLAADVAEQWEDLTGGLLIEGYGMTESSPITLGNPCSAKRRRGTLGLPFPNTHIAVKDPDNPDIDITPDENGIVRGELYVHGPQIFAGYLGRDDETANVLSADGWLRTGDIVEVNPEGSVTLVDRVKEMIVVGGFKVFPSVVEDYLRLMPGVGDIAVVGIPRAGASDEDVLAVLVPHGNHIVPSLEEIREFAAKRLPSYALPKHIEVVEELPRSIIGKVLRRVVRSDHLDRNDVSGE